VVTLRDVAQHLGIHPSTVSRALDPSSAHRVSPETRERIQQAATELGFRRDTVARGLRRGRTNTLGVVVPDLGNPYVAPTIRGIENSLESRGCMAFVAETQDDRSRLARVVDSMISRRVDAIITLAARKGDESILRRASQQVPIVLAVRDLPGSRFPGVIGDDEFGGRLAADRWPSSADPRRSRASSAAVGASPRAPRSGAPRCARRVGRPRCPRSPKGTR
jgi:LacI family transcriptional regulator